jgi:peroxiredoxin/outer membrane lipoprotein-sorting protein
MLIFCAGPLFSADPPATSPQPGPQSEPAKNESRLSGKIADFRHYHAPGAAAGNNQVMVELTLDDGRSVPVALGEQARLEPLALKGGQHLEIRGAAGMADGVPAFIATEVRVNGRTFTLNENAPAAARGNPGGSADSAGLTRELWADLQRKAQAAGRADLTPNQPGDFPTAAKSGQPQADSSAATPAKISPEVRELVQQVQDAYKNLKAMQMTGRAVTEYCGGGSDVRSEIDFTSAFQAPASFRHETMNLTFGSTGDFAYFYNKQTRNYTKQEIPGGQPLEQALRPSLLAVLHAQNPSLLAALLQTPIKDVLREVREVKRGSDVVINGLGYPQLIISGAAGHGDMMVVIDPRSHLLRRMTVNVPQKYSRGADAVAITVDYTSTNTEPKFDRDTFAFQPPAGSKDVSVEFNAATARIAELVGKPAPLFTAPTLGGDDVSLAALKGKVVILDFWASWCPPCRDALPFFGRVFRDLRDADVRFFAVSVQEDKDRVKSFLASERIALPVLLDQDGSVSRSYAVSAIPETVVIGRDGRIAAVFHGLGEDTSKQLREAIDEAEKVSFGGASTGAR